MHATVAGTFMLPASDIDLYFGIGFVPDWVNMWNMSAATNEQRVQWTIHMARKIEAAGGIEIDDDGTISPNAVDVGVAIWRGGNAVTATQYAAGNCLVRDTLDYSKDANVAAAYSDINRWNFVTGYTGYWNAQCDTTFVGAGSMIWIDGKRYFIDALTGNGETSAEVTLSETGVPSGDIQKITNKVDWRVAVTNEKMPAGFWLDSTADLLTDTSELAWFEAGTYDN